MTLPGVIAVLTGADALADGLKPIPHRPVIGAPDIALGKRDASDKFLSPHRVLPHDKARFAGEAVAIVVAESVAAAKHAAELVQVDYEPLPAVTDTRRGRRAGCAAALGRGQSNVCLDADVGDRAATDAAFARAAHVVRFETWVQRVTGVPLEPRAAVGVLRPGKRPLHVVRRQRRHQSPEARARHHSRRRGRRVRVVSRRCRRQFRHAQRLLSRVRADLLGVAAHRPPGEMDVRAARGLSQRLSRPRPPRRGGAGARRGRKLSRPAQLEPSAMSAPIRSRSCR